MVSSDKILMPDIFKNIILKHILHLFPFLGGEIWKVCQIPNFYLMHSQIESRAVYNIISQVTVRH